MLGALLLYLPTLAPDLTWRAGGDDAGDLINAAWQLGVAHSPGYPLYTTLARLALALPFGAPAWRTNLFSALAAAAAAGVLAAAVYESVDRRYAQDAPLAAGAAGLAAGLCLAATPLLWTQATITEVYTLVALLSAAGWLMARRAAARLRAGMPAGPPVLALAFLSGLALTHHLVLLIPLAAAWAYVFWAWLDILVVSAVVPSRFAQQHLQPGTTAPGRVRRPLLWFLAGLSPLVLLPMRAGGAAMADWHHPDTWRGFWALVSGADYHYLLFAGTPGTWAGRAGTALVLLTVGAFGPGVVAVGAAWWDAARHDRPWLVCGLSAVLGNAAYLGIYGAENTLPYTLATLPIVALWLGEGLGLFGRRTAAPAVRRGVLAALVLVQVAGGAAAWAITRAGALDAAGQDAAPAFLARMETILPPDTLLITSADGETFSLWYERYVAGRRPDLLAVDVRLLGAAWYRANLREYDPALAPALDAGPDFAAFAGGAAARRPVAALRADLAAPPGWTWRPQPAGYWRLTPP